jgi:hypothetical protein
MRRPPEVGLVILLLFGLAGCASGPQRLNWSARSTNHADPPDAPAPTRYSWWRRPGSEIAVAADPTVNRATSSPTTSPSRDTYSAADIWPEPRSQWFSRRFPLLSRRWNESRGARDRAGWDGRSELARGRAPTNVAAAPADARDDRDVRTVWAAGSNDPLSSGGGSPPNWQERASSASPSASSIVPAQPLNLPESSSDVELDISRSQPSRDEQPASIETAGAAADSPRSEEDSVSQSPRTAGQPPSTVDQPGSEAQSEPEDRAVLADAGSAARLASARDAGSKTGAPGAVVTDAPPPSAVTNAPPAAAVTDAPPSGAVTDARLASVATDAPAARDPARKPVAEPPPAPPIRPVSPPPSAERRSDAPGASSGSTAAATRAEELQSRPSQAQSQSPPPAPTAAAAPAAATPSPASDRRAASPSAQTLYASHPPVAPHEPRRRLFGWLWHDRQTEPLASPQYAAAAFPASYKCCAGRDAIPACPGPQQGAASCAAAPKPCSEQPCLFHGLMRKLKSLHSCGCHHCGSHSCCACCSCCGGNEAGDSCSHKGPSKSAPAVQPSAQSRPEPTKAPVRSTGAEPGDVAEGRKVVDRTAP